MGQTIQLDGQKGRLDKVLVQETGESRTLIQRQIKKQTILVDGTVQKANYQLQGNELIELLQPVDQQDDFTVVPQFVPFDIIYEDEAILIVNKPSGLVVHPSKGHPNHTLVNGLVYYLKDQLSTQGESYRPGIVHRIDKDTSGLLVVAKTNDAHRFLATEIENKQIQRHYLALVHGRVEPDKGVIDAPIKRHKNHRTRFEVNIDGKEAYTEFEVKKRYEKASLLSVRLGTGRTHQIRVHLEYIHHPIINDPVYSVGALPLDFPLDVEFGQLLHAYQLTLIHPLTKEQMTFEAPLPDAFQHYLNQLEDE